MLNEQPHWNGLFPPFPSMCLSTVGLLGSCEHRIEGSGTYSEFIPKRMVWIVASWVWGPVKPLQ